MEHEEVPWIDATQCDVGETSLVDECPRCLRPHVDVAVEHEGCDYNNVFICCPDCGLELEVLVLGCKANKARALALGRWRSL
jgi:hypothetical protein